ncbi:hypothetical protein MSG28_014120 [Choristoneura fumiferana]|uniref:Uncharacterized protein n=1 Tax=Choristoneura fumiferana TaxID=7141 RepID=A0ACC0JG51_CHOFU|nr:hypothetical protein MSG28_014120 [Choristoneura fumiferana]
MGLRVKFSSVLLIIVQVFSRDVDEMERAARASFVQRLLNKYTPLEDRVRLVGGPNRFEALPSRNQLSQPPSQLIASTWSEDVLAVFCQ